MVIVFVFLQHSGNFRNRKAHINKKISRYIPGAVRSVFFIRPDFSSDIFYIIYSGQNNGLKGCRPITFQIIGTQLRKKIKKYLIVCRRINLINNQYNFPF